MTSLILVVASEFFLHFLQSANLISHGCQYFGLALMTLLLISEYRPTAQACI